MLCDVTLRSRHNVIGRKGKCNLTDKLTVAMVHIQLSLSCMGAYRGSRNIAPPILSHGIIWKLMKIHAPAALTQGKESLVPNEYETNFCHCWGSNVESSSQRIGSSEQCNNWHTLRVLLAIAGGISYHWFHSGRGGGCFPVRETLMLVFSLQERLATSNRNNNKYTAAPMPVRAHISL